MPKFTVIDTILLPREGTRENREVHPGEKVELDKAAGERLAALGKVEPVSAGRGRGADADADKNSGNEADKDADAKD